MSPSIDAVVGLMRELLGTSGLILLIPVVASCVVAVVMAAFQTVTSLHDASLSVAPRLVATVIVLVLLAPWMCQLLIEYASRLFQEAGTLSFPG